MRILVVDNYDSFVFNLVQYLGQLGEQVVVLRNDDDALAEPGATLEGYDAVLISPGPGTPSDAGQTKAMIAAAAASRTPLLGVCLGHQAIGEVFGADVVRAGELLHGKTSPVSHDGTGVLRGLPSPFTVTRYHSLTVDEATLPDELVAVGHSDSGMLMAMRHRDLPIHGVQFHPESVLTRYGHRMLANWLAEAGGNYPEELLAPLEGELAAYHDAWEAVG